jgi:oligopeptide/dipeptide ABC transporter ATP-binding protein
MSSPVHPYARGLLASVPSADEKVDLLPMIEGEPPNVEDLPPGCTFAPRCPLVFDRCVEYPPEFTVAAGHAARCWRLA